MCILHMKEEGKISHKIWKWKIKVNTEHKMVTLYCIRVEQRKTIK